MQTPLLFRHSEASEPARVSEKRGTVYTKPWVTELTLDMAGYDARGDLAKTFAVEPAAGVGAFLVPMPVRLVRPRLSKGREPLECQGALLAYELDPESAGVARTRVSRALIEEGIPEAEVGMLAAGCVRGGDYLAEAAGLPRGLRYRQPAPHPSGRCEGRSRGLPNDEGVGRPIRHLLRGRPAPHLRS